MASGIASVVATTSPAGAAGSDAATTTTVTVTSPPSNPIWIAWVGGATLASFVVITLIGVNLTSENQSGWQTGLFLFSFVVPSLVAFFGIYMVRSDWRDAITAGFVVSYLLMLLSAVGLGFGERATGTDNLRSILVQNFTGLMVVVITFYFGSEAAIEIAKQLTASRVAASSSAAAGASPTTPSSGGLPGPTAEPGSVTTGQTVQGR